MLLSLFSEVLPPEKMPPLEHNSTRGECVAPSKLCNISPVSSSNLDSPCSYTVSESFVVWHLGQSCLHLCKYAGKHTSFSVEKTPFSLYSVRILVTIRSEMTVETLQAQRAKSLNTFQ